MFCSRCGGQVKDGTRFCPNCGAPLQAPGGVIAQLSDPVALESVGAAPRRSSGRAPRPTDPYKDQIQQLRLELKEVKLELKQITTSMSSVRSQYYQTAAFVPRGLMRWGYKAVEDFRLMGPQQQKQRLQQEIMQMEQELLRLQRAQAAWKTNNARS